MTKKEQYESHKKTFLEIRDFFLKNQEYFALAKAFHKPMKFYGEYTKKECMEFMEKLQKQKGEAKASYIKARNEWADTRTAENINGDFEKYKILCDRKRDCMRLGIII